MCHNRRSHRICLRQGATPCPHPFSPSPVLPFFLSTPHFSSSPSLRVEGPTLIRTSFGRSPDDFRTACVTAQSGFRTASGRGLDVVSEPPKIHNLNPHHHLSIQQRRYVFRRA